jgi:sugar phosphate isomerase/epimerase
MSQIAKFGACQGRLVMPDSGELQCFPQGNWQKEFEIASQIGLNFIELLVERQPNKLNPFWSTEGRNKIRKAASENGLDLYSCCYDYVIDNSIEDQNNDYKVHLLNFFNGCKDLSIPIVVFPLLERSDLNTKNYRNFVPIIQKIADELLPDSTELCIETLLPAENLLEFLELVDRPNVSCVYDSGNRIVDRTDLVREIILLNGRIKHFHIKDKNSAGENVILGTGLVNFKTVFDTLRDIKYEGNFSFETTRGQAPKQTMKFHYQFSKFFYEESRFNDV